MQFNKSGHEYLFDIKVMDHRDLIQEIPLPTICENVKRITHFSRAAEPSF